MSLRNVQVKKPGQQSIKSFLSGRSLPTSSRSKGVNNIEEEDRNKKPVATVRPVSMTHHDNGSPPIDLTKSPIISRSKFTFKG